MTNGVFDLLHKGHVKYLQQAAELGASLIIAVNTDRSVRMLGKGPDRPLNVAIDRAYVLAGLTSVDLVTFFETETPVELLQIVRPDFYVKGGDYDMESLEETSLVRSWGGHSISIPFVDGFSTTALVNRIRQAETPLRKAAFLDRDGVINKDKAYVHRWEDFEFVPGAIWSMKELQNSGYELVIVTNQSGLARGFYTEKEYLHLTEDLRQHLDSHGVKLAGVYHCPHHPNGKIPSLRLECNCRKPAPGMLLKAARELHLSLPDSILIGDKLSDIEAARAAGVGHAYLVNSDNLQSDGKNVNVDGHYADLLNCVTNLMQNLETPK
jgi:D-glycero-D-manno-heptose 1,7-bisphosphate phosphatase